MHSLALGLMFCNAATLTQCETKEQFLTSITACEKRCADSLLRVANAFRLKRNAWTAMLASTNEWCPPLVPDAEPSANKPYNRVVVNDVSACLADLDAGLVWEIMWTWLPNRYRYGYTPKIAYSSTQHGWSLRTLFSSARAVEPPFILYFRTKEGKVVGAFLPCPLVEDSQDQSVNSGEIFVFCIQPSGDMQRHVWSEGNERPTVRYTSEFLSIAGNALCIDNELANGYCGPSEAFGMAQSLLYEANEQAKAGGKSKFGNDTFRCVESELWTLQNVNLF